MLHGNGSWLTSIAYSPDGKSLVTASPAGEIRFWRAATGEPTGSLTVDRGIRRAFFAPNGNGIVWASMDGTVEYWSATPVEDIPGFDRSPRIKLPTLFVRCMANAEYSPTFVVFSHSQGVFGDSPENRVRTIFRRFYGQYSQTVELRNLRHEKSTPLLPVLALAAIIHEKRDKRHRLDLRMHRGASV